MSSFPDLGFDAVDCVMSIEATFDIRIRNRDAERLQTVEDLILLVAGQVRLNPAQSGSCPSATAFYRIKRRIKELDPAPDVDIRPGTPTALLLGAGDRKALWLELRERLVLDLPPLCLGPFASLLLPAIFLLAYGSGAAMAWFMGGTGLAFTLAFTAFIPTVMLLVLATVFAERRWGKTIPFEAATVGDLAYLEFLQQKRADPSNVWTLDEIQSAVRHVVAKCSGFPVRQVRPDTSFLELNAITG